MSSAAPEHGPARARERSRRLPLLIKLIYTLFLCVLVPAYWREYGVAHFLWLSDIALFLGLLALWLESRLLASIMAVGVLLLEIGWNLDYFGRLLTGAHLTTLTRYMFDPSIPLFVRALSLFHVPMPFFMLWLVRRLGYDRRALLWQTLLTLAVIPLSSALTSKAENVNWVRGLGAGQKQLLPPWLWLLMLMVLYPAAVFVPTHLLLRRLFGRRKSAGQAGAVREARAGSR